MFLSKKKQLLVGLFGISMHFVATCGEIEIKLLQPCFVKDTKQMIIECVFDLWQTPLSLEEFEKGLDAVNEFCDLYNLQSAYFDNQGIFYIACDDDKVIGSGAIKKLDDERCELKRMWFLKDYRGKGLGLAIVNKLFEFAKNQGYKKVQLDVYFPDIQKQAVAFYTKLGFYEIEPYKISPAQLYMEKIL